MTKLNIVLPLFLCSFSLTAMSQDTETEIRNLEQMEVKAVLAKDTVALKKLWDAQFVVNSPLNTVVPAVANSVSRPVLNNPRTSFTREIEHITVRGDVAFSMGNETVGTPEQQSGPEQVVKRRFTNVWIKTDGVWKLAARHANNICPDKK